MSLILLILAGAIGAGFLLGGSLRPFEHVRMHLWGAALLGLGMQVVPAPGLDARSRLAAAAMLAGSYGFLAAFVGVNRRMPAALAMLVGLGLNLAVTLPNAGMPVSAAAIRAAGGSSFEVSDARHHLAQGGDVLATFGDTIPVPGLRVVLSPGDVLLYGAIAWLVVAVMRGRFRETPRPPARLLRMYRGKHEPVRYRPWAARWSREWEAPPVAVRWGTGR